jgi:hypothetical protein
MKQITKNLNSNILKTIAVISMTIDHIAWAIFPGFSMHPIAIIMHILGRIACPIFCYFMVQGYIHTKNFKKYFSRILIFALISHIPYVLTSFNYVDALSLIPGYHGVFNQTSILWGFACGLLLIRVNDSKLNNIYKLLLSIFICLISFPADWSCVAPLIILFMWEYKDNFKMQMITMFLMIITYVIVYFFEIDKIYALLQFGIVLSIPLLYLYNGKVGNNIKLNKIMKWFFYIYYPLHLLIIFIFTSIFK